LSYSFSDGKESKKEAIHLRELISEYVFCPKCGSKNNFSSVTPTQTSFFCQRCSTKISDYWESFRKGKIQTVDCELCGQLTFGSLKYCISCGDIKEKAAQERSDMIAEQVTKKRSRFITGKAKISFIAGIAALSVGVFLVLIGFLAAWDSSAIIVDVLLYIGLILLGISVILIIVIPLIVFLIALKKGTY